MQALDKHYYPPCASLGILQRKVQIMKTPALLELTFLVRRGRHSTREVGKMYILPGGERTLEENKAGRQDRDRGETATLNMVRGGLTEVTQAKSQEGVIWASGEVFQAEGTASASVLR